VRKGIALGDPAVLYQIAQAYGKIGDKKAAADYLAQYKLRMGKVRDGSPASTTEITPP
jgi:hypothetical protein